MAMPVRDPSEGLDPARALDLAAALARDPDPVATLDASWRWTFVNPAAERVLGRERREVLGRTLWETWPALSGTPDEATLRLAVAERSTLTLERRHRPSGRCYEVQIVGSESGLLLHARDVTERRRTLDEARFQAQVLELAGQAVIATDLEGRLLYWNKHAELLTGWSAHEVLGRNVMQVVPAPQSEAEAKEALALLRAGKGWSGEVFARRRDGSSVALMASATPLDDAQGHLVALVGVGVDISARKRTEEALRASEERYRLATRATRDVIYDWDLRSNALELSDAISVQFRYPPGAVRPELAWWEERVHPDDRQRLWDGLMRVIAERAEVWEDEYRFLCGDGTWAIVYDSGYLMCDASGTPMRLIGAMRDLTVGRALEEQLRQAQKMEALGRLAGGIAHDFNNILTAIATYAELAVASVPPATGLHEDLEEIRRSVARGASLTRQLLALGRRQVMQTRVVDPNTIVASAERLLRRLVNESIQFVTELDPDVGAVRADPGQLEQVLMNLVVNARDAMVGGGTLTIRTRNVSLRANAPEVRASGLHPGPYVLLEVSDTGSGMDAATRERVFEPFFTTKAQASGTGLGLSMVYGIIEQSGGHITVDSMPGRGSTFRILLPRADGGAAAETAVVARHEPPRAPLEGATILVVEDEDAVRASVRRILERSGYAVLEARDGAEALELWEREGEHIDLVLTDVVMPRLGGRELVSRIRALRPDARVLLMSGYTDDTQAAMAQLPPGTVLIEKPFKMDTLLANVRDQLTHR